MGSKPILILSCPVADMLPSVLPWKDLFERKHLITGLAVRLGLAVPVAARYFD